MKFTLITSVLITASAYGQVVVQKTGAADMYIFPSRAVVTHQVGTLKVGDTITIRYSLRIAKNGKARFIAMDSAKVARMRFAPELEPGKDGDEGFMIEDKNVNPLQVYFDSEKMKKVAAKADRKALNQAVSHEANLDVEFTNEKGKIRISRVTVN